MICTKISLKTRFLAVILLIGVLFSATGCDILNILYGPTIEDAKSYMFDGWEVQIPEGAKMNYYESCIGFPSDGGRYCVFTFEEEPTEFIADFSYEESEEFKDEFNQFFGWLIADLEREGETFNQDYAFNWEWEYCWKLVGDWDELFMLYRPETLQLYVLMNYM
ncbi:MAG: hypothetical protein E7370_00790 [Clostridiales bacterium]|nr:hypothetical protein [Clostridiales bacterium]